MRRPAVALAIALVVAVGIAWWRCGAKASDEPGNGSSATPAAPSGQRAVRSQPRPDPTGLPRAAIAGTIRDQRGVPIANARVCARGYAGELADELLRAPICVPSDPRGGYAIEGLLAATYVAWASAAKYQPATWGEDDRMPRELRLRGGERRNGIDLVLHDGGVELVGTVSDLTGGPIAGARVWGFGVSLVETDAQGGFSMWVKPGGLVVTASAEGYADSTDDLEIPRAAVAQGTPVRMDIVLTPESSLAGTVVDAASGEPIAGARVIVGQSDWGWDSGETTFTDERGRFRVSRLIPKRYVVVARTSNGFGRTEGSLLVGLAQALEGVEVRVFPAFRIDGRILTPAKQDCERGLVSLQDRVANRFLDLSRAGDGSHFADGALPGTYDVTIYCPGALVHERYEPIVIRDRDAVGLVWEVENGATLRGKVVTSAGAAVADAHVTASRKANARDKHTGGGTASRRDGSYEITGLRPGSYQLTASSDRGVVAKTTESLELAGGAVVERNLVLVSEDVGEIAGTIVDVDGRPVGDAVVNAAPVRRTDGSEASDPSGAAGTFSIGSLRPGDYLLTVSSKGGASLRTPGTTDDTARGERVTVRGGQIATIRLVVEGLGGRIAGVVVDAKGAAVSDAFVSAARESDAAGAASSAYRTRWTWNEKPVLTAPDGTFTLTNLAPGKYAIRAYRRGGGEAIAEHVASGDTARLTIEATGSIAGTVRRGGANVGDFAVTVRELTSGYRRRDQFFHTDGRYQLGDLPKGKYVVAAEAIGGAGQLEIELAEGQARSGVDLALEGFVTLTGRVVEHGTTTPVANIQVTARRLRGGGMYAQGDGRDHISNEAGRFTVRDVPQGDVLINGWGSDDAGYASLQAYRKIAGSGAIDIGDLAILKRRIKPSETPGELGVRFAEQTLDTPPAARQRKVSFVDPQGPAAKSGIEVGDVVVAIDGVDVRGENAHLAHTLVSAPPGTKLSFQLARGPTVTIVLGNP